jgi:hypothetical protein
VVKNKAKFLQVSTWCKSLSPTSLQWSSILWQVVFCLATSEEGTTQKNDVIPFIGQGQRNAWPIETSPWSLHLKKGAAWSLAQIPFEQVWVVEQFDDKICSEVICAGRWQTKQELTWQLA